MSEKTCPLLKTRCVEHRCRWYIQLLGNDPQTGERLNKWGCAVEWLPVLLIENSQQQRQTAAAVEAFRNESVNNARSVAAALVEVANAAAQGGVPALKDLNQTAGAVLEHKRSS